MDFDWKPLAGSLLKVGGAVLGPLVAGPAGAAVGPMIASTLASALGCDPTPDALDEALRREDAGKIVAQVETQHGPALVAAQDAYLADIASARAQTVELAKAGTPIAWSAPIISIVIVLGFLALVGALLFRAVPDSNVTLVLFGALSTAFGQVVNYWLGSSKSSADKTADISALLAKVVKHG